MNLIYVFIDEFGDFAIETGSNVFKYEKSSCRLLAILKFCSQRSETQ